MILSETYGDVIGRFCYNPVAILKNVTKVKITSSILLHITEELVTYVIRFYLIVCNIFRVIWQVEIVILECLRWRKML